VATDRRQGRGLQLRGLWHLEGGTPRVGGGRKVLSSVADGGRSETDGSAQRDSSPSTGARRGPLDGPESPRRAAT